MTTHNFDFWIDALGEPSKWGKKGEGNRDASWPCPMGGGDDPNSTSLHITERSGRDALIKDFAHDHSKAELAEYVAGTPNASTPKLAAPKSSKAKTVVATYEYTDEKGAPLHRTLRYEPKGFGQEHFEGGRWIAGLKGIEPVPYRFSELLDAITKGEQVWIVDGEKDADRLVTEGVTATCAPMGMERWQDEWSALFTKGSSVVIIQDKDGGSGERAARKLRLSLHRRGVEVIVLQAAVGKDVSDHLDQQRTLDELIPTEQLAAMPLSGLDRSDPMPLKLGYLDPEDHTIIFGDGSVGKGVVAAWWAAQITKEEPEARVYIVDYERHARYEWRPRVEDFGGDMDRVFVVQPKSPIWDAAEELAIDAENVGATYAICDSAVYAVGDLEPEKASTAARYSKAIAEIGLPMLTLAHTTKTNPDPQHPFGSTFWHNGARVTIGMSTETAKLDSSRRILRCKKTNQRGKFAPVAIPWEWTDTLGPSEVPSELDFQPFFEHADQRAREVLFGKGWMTAKAVTEEVNRDGGKNLDVQTVRKAMDEDAKVRKDGTGRGVEHRYRYGFQPIPNPSTNPPPAAAS